MVDVGKLDPSVSFLRDVGISVAFSSALAFVASVFGQPLIIAYIISGAVIGPHLGLGLIQDEANIELISEIGLILLMFILGQEINLKGLVRSGRFVFIAGLAQAVLSFVFAWFMFGFMDFSTTSTKFDQLYLSFVFCLSSTMVVIKTLTDRFDLKTLVSQLTVGILVIQDLLAISFLSLQPTLDKPELFVLAASLMKGVVLVGASFAAARFILPSIFSRILQKPELVLTLSMGWCFLITGFSDTLGLSKEVGALVAGVSIASFPFHVDVALKLSSLRDFFITLFFVALGLRMPTPTAQTITLALLISGALILSRFVTIFFPLYFLKLGMRSSTISAINLAQLSEFAPIILSLGIQKGHVSPEVMSTVLLVLVFTILFSSYAMPYGHQISELVSRILKRLGFTDLVGEKIPQDLDATDTSKPPPPPPRILILGFFRDASSLLYEWASRENPAFLKTVLTIDYNPIVFQKLKQMGVQCAYGDVGNPDTVLSNDLSAVEFVICTMPDQSLRGTSNLKLLIWLKQKIPEVKIIVTAETIEGAIDLYKHGANYVYPPRILAAQGLLDAIKNIEEGNGESLKQAHLEALKNRHEVIP